MTTTPTNEQQEVFQTEKEEFVFYQCKDEDPTGKMVFQNVIKEVGVAVKFIEPQHTYIKTTLKPAIKRTQINEELTVEIEAFKKTNIFGKNFESGNLNSVKVLTNGVYRLTLSNDCHSRKQCQWFYFSCQGLQRARFQIAGFTKPASLYNYGMKICVNETGRWQRGGQYINYTIDSQGEGYCLNFSFTFKHSSNKTLFAYCFPYTFTDLRNKLEDLESRKLAYLSVSTVAKSLMQNNVYCFTITNTEVSSASKQTIVLTARTHPGETVSSHIMQGFLDALLNSSVESQLLRRKFIFRVIPMINPDGVVLGNYRLSYSGHDLNRKWKETSARLHPQIYGIKQLLMEWNQISRIRLMIDMHGHSRKKGIFFYGNQNKKLPHICRELPFIMSNVCKSYHYRNCSFVCQKSKSGTQRIAMSEILKLPHVYTLEASFCSDENSLDNYSIQDLNRIGGKLVDGFVIYLAKDLSQDKKLKTEMYSQYAHLIEDSLNYRESLMKEMYSSKELLKVGTNSEDQGSDSVPSEGCLSDDQLLKILKSTVNQQKCQSASYKLRGVKEVKQTLKNVVQRFPERHSIFVERQKDILLRRTGRCKVSVINGSIFDKSFKKQPLDTRVKCYTQEIVKNQPVRNKPLMGLHQKNSQYLRDHRRVNTWNVSATINKIEASEVGAPPSFYPSKKNSIQARNSNDYGSVVVGRREMKLYGLEELRISPEKQCRKLRILH